MSRLRAYGVVERMLQSACAATRCRQAIPNEVDEATRVSLERAAQRYSQNIAALAEELIAGGAE